MNTFSNTYNIIKGLQYSYCYILIVPSVKEYFTISTIDGADL